MNNFFDRIMQVSKSKGFKNITDFAKNGLLYNSSEKLNRLKKPTNRPSFEILHDISKRFDDVNLNWLITGKGKMQLNDNAMEVSAESSVNYSNLKDHELIKSKDKIIRLLEAEVQRLEDEIVRLKQ